MTSLTDSAAIFRYHHGMLSIYGDNSPHALGWRDRESQLIRFKVLTEIGNLNNCSVLDGGCGYADLYPFLLNRYPHLGHYCGLEQIPELLDKAIKDHGHKPGTQFIAGNFIAGKLPVLDYILASGSLNYTSDDPNFIFKAIARLYDHCTFGLGFNLLREVTADGLLVAYDPAAIIAYCRTISNDVKLIEGYAEEDFTVFMYKKSIA